MIGRAGAILIVLWACPCEASLFDAFGFGPRGTGLANAWTAGSEDYFAAYYNPANLVARRSLHLGYGINYLQPMLSIDRRDDDIGVPLFEPRG